MSQVLSGVFLEYFFIIKSGGKGEMGVVMGLPCTSQFPQYISQFNDQCVDSLLVGMEVTKEQDY